MADLNSKDVGQGYTRVYQRGRGGVRAVVKDALGNIVVAGPVVPEERAVASERKALMDFMALNLAPSKAEPIGGVLDGYSENDIHNDGEAEVLEKEEDWS